MPPDIPKIEAPVTVLPPTVEAVPVKPTQPPQVGDVNKAPTTTAAEDVMTAGQRRINLIWEITQALIAITVTGTTLYVSATIVLSPGGDKAGAFLLMSNVFFMVASVYLTRTNHSKTGGVQKGDTGR